MKIAFRLDASAPEGNLSLERCAALARALAVNGSEVLFVCQILTARAAVELRGLGIDVRVLAGDSSYATASDSALRTAQALASPQVDDARLTVRALQDWAPDWVVVDHPMLDSEWHRHVAEESGAKICVIDRLADRDLAADIVVDNTDSSDHRQKFRSRVAPSVRILGGGRFALSGEDQAPRHALHASVRSIGVVVPEIDGLEFVLPVLTAIRSVAKFSGPIEVAARPDSEHLKVLRDLAAADPALTLAVGPGRLNGLGRDHDLHVFAHADPRWEQYNVGTPTIAVAPSSAELLEARKCDLDGGARELVVSDEQAIGRAVASLVSAEVARRALWVRAVQRADDLGAKRIALALLAEEVKLETAEAQHARRAFLWRNDERVRRFSRDPRPFTLGAHLQWWQQTLSNPNRPMLVVSCGAMKVGIVRLDVSTGVGELSVYLDPNLTGSGLGVAVLRSTQAWVGKNLPDVARINAFVFPDNRASNLVFAAAGFSRGSATDWYWDVAPL